MSFDVDNKDEEKTIAEQNDEIIELLKAILMGIEIIADAENLIDQIED